MDKLSKKKSTLLSENRRIYSHTISNALSLNLYTKIIFKKLHFVYFFQNKAKPSKKVFSLLNPYTLPKFSHLNMGYRVYFFSFLANKFLSLPIYEVMMMNELAN